MSDVEFGYTDEEWRQRLRTSVEQTLSRRAERAAERMVLDARRRAGLRSRHASKLARRAGGGDA